VAAFATCAFLIISTSKTLPNLFSTARTTPVYSALPLDDLTPNGAVQDSVVLTKDGGIQRHQGKVRVTVLLAATVALSLRIELYRQISNATECTIPSLEIYLPILIAVYDALRFQRSDISQAGDRPPANNGYELWRNKLSAMIETYVLKPRYRYILSTFLFCYGCHLVIDQWHPLNSTYICPIVLNQHSTIPYAQTASLVLDGILAIIVYEMLPRKDGSGLSPRRSVVLWSSTLTGVTSVWSLIGLIFYLAKPERRLWLLLVDSADMFSLVFSITLQSVLFSVFCITTLHSVSSFTSDAEVWLTSGRS
jgi:hypothetical protein